jgi:hypothetical protein
MILAEIYNRHLRFYDTETSEYVDPPLGGIWKASGNYSYSGWKHFKKCKLREGDSICLLVPDSKKIDESLLDLSKTKRYQVAGNDSRCNLELVANIIVKQSKP